MSRSRRPAPSLPERVLRTVAARSLLEPCDGVVVAVSGGPDSLALLHVLGELGAGWSLRLVVAHLDHGMRPGTAEADAAFVAAEAGRLGLPCIVEGRDVPALARAQRLSLEEAGREARYELLGRVAAEYDCPRIATGHTADDRVETVLLNIARGTGLDGLAGIPARRPLRAGSERPEVVRPLIDCWRTEVVAYCDARGLTPRHDATNARRDFARNRVRRELLPRLERELSPRIKERLLRLAAQAEEETAFLRAMAREHLERALVSRSETSVRLDAAAVGSAPAPLARRILREAVRELRPDSNGGDWDTLQALLRLARGELTTAITLPGSGIAASREGGTLLLRRPAPAGPGAAAAIERVLPVPGAVSLPEAGLRVEARHVPRPASLRTDPAREAYLDLERLRPPLVVRTPLPGDRITPLGMRGRRKLHDIFIDRKVPRDQRTRIPVVADAERILWVVGCCTSDEVKVRDESTRVLQLTARAISAAA